MHGGGAVEIRDKTPAPLSGWDGRRIGGASDFSPSEKMNPGGRKPKFKAQSPMFFLRVENMHGVQAESHQSARSFIARIFAIENAIVADEIVF